MIGKNFIKPLPEGMDIAVDTSLLYIQIRARKDSESGRNLKKFIDEYFEESK